jgi:hypothetical protein
VAAVLAAAALNAPGLAFSRSAAFTSLRRDTSRSDLSS